MDNKLVMNKISTKNNMYKVQVSIVLKIIHRCSLVMTSQDGEGMFTNADFVKMVLNRCIVRYHHTGIWDHINCLLILINLSKKAFVLLYI